MIFQYDDYRDVLRQRFEERHERNPSYSQRAFARDLKISASRLSEVMSKRHHLSGATAGEVARRLELEGPEQAFFCDLVESHTARSELARKQAQARLLKYRFADEETQLSIDQFKLIADWYHFAIVELFKTKDCPNTAAAISKALNIPRATAKTALARLVRLGFLAVEDDGLTHGLRRGRSFVDSYASPQALRDFHSQVLARAIDAVASEPRTKRVSLSAVAAIDAQDVDEIRRDVTTLINTFTTRRARQKAADHVYCMTVQLFQLDRGDDDTK